MHFAALAGLSSLRSLAVRGNYRTGAAELEQVVRLTRLQTLLLFDFKAALSLRCQLSRMECMEPLSDLIGLTALSHLALPCVGRAPGGNSRNTIPALERLYTTLVDGLPCLQTLDVLDQLCILLDVEADAASLRALPAAGSPLRELCLRGCMQLGDHAAEALAELTALTKLGSCDTSISASGVRALASAARLRELNLHGNDGVLADAAAALWAINSITDTGLRPLRRLTRLTSLSLDWCSALTNEGIEDHVAPLTQQALSRLSLHRCYRITQDVKVSLHYCIVHGASFSHVPASWPPG
ncbi:hypothetical protein WJX81_006992 [Elliptochloris bilobata]|uniref:Receptor-type protein kinase n=1 Tax=Elliptochloris bilobata TaxID=381761 RepID=A0AAW1RXN0_9CHLO